MLPVHQIRAALDSHSINVEKRTVDVVWSTGHKGLRRGWDSSYYEELSMDPSHVDLSRLNSGAPLLRVHDNYSLDSVIGVVESARIENGKGFATVRFSKDEAGQKVFEKVQDGILRNISVGYNVAKYENVTGPNDKIETYRAVNWTPAELSIVPVGFDPSAQIRENERLTMSEVEIVDTRSKQQKETEMSEVKPQPQIDQEALKKEAIEAEKKRAAGILKAVKDAKLPDSLAQDMIERDLSLEEAQRNVLAYKKAQDETQATKIDSTVRIEVGTDEVDKKRDQVAQATLFRGDSKNFKLENGNTLGGYSFLRAMETIVKRNPNESDSMYATRVMSSSDLPKILANVAEKAALGRYSLAGLTWNRWAQSGSLRNYKQNDFVRAGDFSSLVEKPEGAEYVLGSFGESREQATLKTYGRKMAVTREMIVNDDLDQVMQVMSEGGRAAARLENELVYAQLTSNPTMGDGVALFHSTHANLGTAGDISVASIGEAIKLMKQQTSVDAANKLNLAPKYLICGPTQESEALKFLSQIVPAQAANVNPYSGSLQLIVDAEITNNNYFFACDPSDCETIKLFRLQGEESPVIESRTNFDNDDIELKIRHSAVAKALDHRGLVKNADS